MEIAQENNQEWLEKLTNDINTTKIDSRIYRILRIPFLLFQLLLMIHGLTGSRRTTYLLGRNIHWPGVLACIIMVMVIVSSGRISCKEKT